MTDREYEAMFLLDNQAATADFEAAAGQVDAILEKHGAELVLKEKWDERKLAYEIKGHRRATYYLVYMRAAPAAITEIDTDVHLNEVILRHLVLALDEPIDQHIANRDADREKMAEESRRSSLSGWGDRRRGDRAGPKRDRGPDDEPAAAVKPAADKPAEEKPAEEKPAAEKPAEEKPAAEKPAAEKPAEEKPAVEKATPSAEQTAGPEAGSDNADKTA